MTTRKSDKTSFSDEHADCLMCGYRNPWSLGLRFHAVDENTISAQFKAHLRLQGYQGVLHGGVISALLDAAMTHRLFHQGVRAITGELRVRFLKLVPCDAVLELRSWLLTVRRPLYIAAAELVREGTVVARAEARFMETIELQR